MQRCIATLAMIALAMGAGPLCAQAPWLSAGVHVERDNQPRDVLRATAGYGAYLSPSITLAAAVTALDIDGAITAEPGAAATLALPAARLGLATGVSTVLGTHGSAPALWAARAGLNLGRDVSLRFSHQRARYTATLASLDTTVLVQTAEARIDRAGAPGWAGELAVRRESFGDGNPIATAWGWALAPLSRSRSHSLRVGYSLALQDAAHSAWVRDDTPRRAGRPVQSAVPGRYAPYYTPHDVVVHSVLVGAALGAGRGWIVFDGSYGIHANELAPVLYTVPGGGDTELLFYERSFSPYRVAAAWTTPVQASASVTIELSHARTAYYRTTAAGIRMARSATR